MLWSLTQSFSGLAAQRGRRRRRRPRAGVRLVALDMDGTLLDSASRVLPSSVAAMRAALAQGVRVCLATGKARPAAMAALLTVGLVGGRPGRAPLRGKTWRQT